LQSLAQISAENDVLLHIHVAETETEVAQITAQYGARPFQHLVNLGLATPRLLAAHMVWLEEQELDLAAKNAVKVATNPISNLKLCSGVAPLVPMLKRGITVGIGTDGCASNNNLDLFGEMKTLSCLHKWTARDATALNAATTLKLATNAAVLGLENITGKIAPGWAADLTILDFAAPHLHPCYDRVAQTVYAAQGSDVSAVMVAGKWLLRDRQLLTLDEAEILHEIARIADEVKKAVGR
jgi:5-methylthioadenosine/S-adenosylhomocysteine deaminase